ncbi:MAG: recombination mediator RecR [Rhabdochlamydiaceae bacterium]|nr:recombination mediator RecR [Rhabdochlamydiaceae bacterium]
MPKYPAALTLLIAYLKKLPGVGTKTAERFAFQLLDWPAHEIQGFSNHLSELKEKITHCPTCHCLTDNHSCPFCADHNRNASQLCIIASARDVFSIEETGTFRGHYHVLGGLLSPIDGTTPEHLNLGRLKKRVDEQGVKEMIIALDSTLEGDTTSLYLKEQIQAWGLSVSRLAFGIPLGSSLDFVDGGTLARAFTARQVF